MKKSLEFEASGVGQGADLGKILHGDGPQQVTLL